MCRDEYINHIVQASLICKPSLQVQAKGVLSPLTLSRLSSFCGPCQAQTNPVRLTRQHKTAGFKAFCTRKQSQNIPQPTAGNLF